MTPTDTFARFVDALAATLDDPTGYTERVHLSRFHLDRIVSAVAGEPPGALRRRILLERAGHRLLTTDDDLLPVAFDAGYSSHEAFTRAFRRAYGRTPSDWRRHASRFHLAAANGVHFHPPAGLRLRPDRKGTQMDLLIRMVEHDLWLVGEMIDRAQTLPEATLDAPIELSVDGIDEEPTVRSLLARLVGQLDMWTSALDGRPYDFDVESNECLGHMRARLARVGPAFLAEVRSAVDEGRLEETFVDAICEPPEVFSFGGMIAHVLTFSAHRRTLALGALSDAGITDLGPGDPMRWVAEAA